MSRAGGCWVLVTMTMTSLACQLESPGWISAQGVWADGAAIHFSADAQASRAGGRVQVWATSSSDPRFSGVRFSYDPDLVTAPGRYEVDPAPLGSLELYCVRPAEGEAGLARDRVEYEVSSAVIVIDKLPDEASSRLEGTFEQVVLRRDQMILELSHGRFEADVPRAH